MTNDDAAATTYGGIAIGSLQLALPTEALREVVPLERLVPIPCLALSVIGAVDLRGILLPVVDLAVLLGHRRHEVAHRSVAVMVHEGRLLGLAIDAVTGIFRAEAPGLCPIDAAQGQAPLITGSLRRDDGAGLVGVLSPRALAAIRHVPMARDPDPHRLQTDSTDVDAATPEVEAATSLMLFRSGTALLAIDATAVQSTIPAPRPEPSPVSGGSCRGLLAVGDRRIPAVDLADALGLAADESGDLGQAFVIRVGEGSVACLISEVIDIIRPAPGDVVALEPFGFRLPGLLRGALPRSAVKPEVLRRTDATAAQFLVIDPEALARHETLASLSGIELATDEAAQAGRRADRPVQAELAGGRPLVTFLLQREAATPLAQVVEILPWTPDLAVSQPGGTLVGIALSRGRSIPVLCLASLLGQAPPTRSASSSILVVETGAALTGFLVRALQGIEQARWEPRMPLAAPAADDALSAALQSGEHVLVGTGAGQRTLSLLDLRRIANALRPPQARELAAPLPQPASLDCTA